MLTAVVDEVIKGPEADSRFGKHLTVTPTVQASRAGRYQTQAVIVTTAARRIIELSKGGDKLANILVRGEIEPTLHPDFREISENLRELCHKWYPRASLNLITVNPNFDSPDARAALHAYHKIWCRLEAGTQKTFTAMTGQPGKNFKDLVEVLSGVEANLIMDANFVRGDVDNSTDSEVKAWLKYVTAVKPTQLLITSKALADTEKKTKPITKTRLNEIFELASEKLEGTAVELVD